MKKAKECALCGNEVFDNVIEPFACWRCTMYFSQKPDRAVVVHSRTKDKIKQRLLEDFFPEEPEEELDGNEVRTNMVRKGHHSPIKLKN